MDLMIGLTLSSSIMYLRLSMSSIVTVIHECLILSDTVVTTEESATSLILGGMLSMCLSIVYPWLLLLLENMMEVLI